MYKVYLAACICIVLIKSKADHPACCGKKIKDLCGLANNAESSKLLNLVSKALVQFIVQSLTEA